MGNEVSRETSEANAARFEADFQALVDAKYPEDLKRYQDMKITKDKRITEERAAHQRAAEQRATAEARAEEARVAEQRAAAERRAEKTRAVEQRAAAEKRADERRLTDARLAAEKCAAEEARAAAEKHSEEGRVAAEKQAAAARDDAREQTATAPPPRLVRSSKGDALLKRPLKPTASALEDSDDQPEVAAKNPRKRKAADDDQATDGKKAGLAGIGTFRKNQSSKSSAEPAEPAQAQVVTSIVERPPKWYKDLSKSGTRDKHQANADTLLIGLKSDITKVKAGKGLDHLFDSIRTKLHSVAFEYVSGQLLKNNRMLDDEYGLPRLFDASQASGVQWPFDIKADAEELYNKWCRRIFEPDLMRGLRPHKPEIKVGGKVLQESQAAIIDPSYKDQVSSKYYGNGLLLNGQWWPLQIAAVRDGAHGAMMEGIYGGQGMPAYSCIVAGGEGYDEDKDKGDEVFYCGTDRTDGKLEPSAGTQCLIKNCELKQPVRFLRSHNLHSPYRPDVGLRYDGLYDVVSYRKVEPEKRQRHVFRLLRVPGQDPIRGTEPAKRPTKQEVEAYQKDRKNRGLT